MSKIALTLRLAYLIFSNFSNRSMGKRTVFDDAGDVKKRRKSIISGAFKNPLESDGFARCFKTVSATMHVSVAPIFSLDAKKGIQRQHLDPLMMKYNPKYDGVVIAHSGIELLGQDEEVGQVAVGKVLNDSPFSFLWVKVDLLVWSPKKGDLLEGWVSVQSPSHISLLVHDVFNATIKREDIPDSWTFEHVEDDEEDRKSLGYWTDSKGNRIGGKQLFNVKIFSVAGRTVLVQGSLLQIKDIKEPRISSLALKNGDIKSKSVAAASSSTPGSVGISSQAVSSGSDTSSSSDSSSDLSASEREKPTDSLSLGNETPQYASDSD